MKRFFYVAAFVLGMNSIAFACRPLSTDDAGTVQPKHMQVELGAEYLKWSSSDKEFSVSAVLTTGVIWDRLDFAVGMPYLWLMPEEEEKADGIGDAVARFKLRFIDETEKMPAMAFTAGVKTKTGDRDKELGTGTSDFTGNLIATKCIGKLTLHGNIGYNYTGDLTEEEISDFINTGIAGCYALTDRFTLTSEIYGEVAVEDTDEDNPFEILIGGIYCLSCGTALDAGISVGLTDASPDYKIVAGMTHVF